MAPGESTPLLSSSQAAAQDEEASPLLAASAPPPADAPPPVPGEEEESPLKDGNNNPSWMHKHKKQHSSTSIETNNTTGDASGSQLSLTQSKKQRRGAKKKRGGDASSSNHSTSTNTTKRSKKKKKQSSSNNAYDGPKKSIPHFLFDIVRYLAIFASVAMLFMQFIPILLLDKQHNDLTGLQYFVRIYLIIFCISFILLESRIPLLRRLSFPAHENWILRGFMYTFIGVIGMEQDVAIKVEDIASGTANILGPDYGTLFASLSIAITTWIMVGVGCLYMVLGVMCLQKWYENLEKEYKDKIGEWKRKKKREKEIQKEKEEYVKYEKDRREGRGEWYDDIETGK
jgi:hypothetical protein